MNKKLLLGAALLVGMGTTFTSCVDSTESESVTNVREAKAAQLRSIADLNKALAEKELILANADKATQEAQQALAAAQAEYQKAQAEYLKAQAELLKAQADLVNAQTDAEKAKLKYQLDLLQAELDAKAVELDKAKAELAYQQQRYELQLEQLKAQIELNKVDVANAWWQYNEMVKAAQKAEEDAEKQAILEAAANIKTLISKYDSAFQRLIRAKYELAQDQMTLARLEAGIEDAKNLANEQILTLQSRNKYLEKQIAFEEGYINTYYKWMGTIITQEMWDEALYNLVKSEVDIEDYEADYNAAEKAEEDAFETLATSQYITDVMLTLNDASGSYTYENKEMERTETYFYTLRNLDIEDNDPTIPADCRGTYYLRVGHYVSDGMKDTGETDPYEEGMIWTYTPVYQIESTKLEKLDNGDSYSTYDSYFNLVNKGAGLKAWLDCKLNTLEKQTSEKNLEAAQKELADAKAYQTKAIAELGKAKTAYTEAESKTKAQATVAQTAHATTQAAWDKYVAAAGALTAESTDAEKDAVKALEKAYTDAQTAEVTAANKLQELGDAQAEAQITKEKWIKAVDYAALWVQAATIDVNAAQNGDDSNAALVEYYTNLVDEIVAEEATNNDNISAYNEASKAFAEAEAKNNELFEANDEAYGEYINLYFALLFNGGIVGGNADANELVMGSLEAIAGYEAEIESNNAQIAEYEAAIEKYDSEEYYNEITIQTQMLIELDQAALATAQQLYDIAKAELDAALAEQQK
ncbi:MAG: hypothetical protein K2L11_08195 [Muribaculaceae bacterium]|nr:hypothetical protein [Muribaculaceae bacterium]